MTPRTEEVAVLEAGGFYWNGIDELRQVVGIKNRQVEFVNLLEPGGPVHSVPIEQMGAWGAQQLNFHIATSIRDMLLAARMRLTTRQKSLLIERFPLRASPYITHPPAAEMANPQEQATAEALIERGILASVPAPKRAVPRVRLTELRGLPLARVLQGHPPLMDFRSS